jgi:hypothetical protein
MFFPQFLFGAGICGYREDIGNYPLASHLTSRRMMESPRRALKSQRAGTTESGGAARKAAHFFRGAPLRTL